MVEGGKWWSMRNVVKVAVPVSELNRGLSDVWFDGGYDVIIGDGGSLERGVCKDVRQGVDLEEEGSGPLLGSSEGDFQGHGALDVGSGTHTTGVLDQSERSNEGVIRLDTREVLDRPRRNVSKPKYLNQYVMY
ncbi:hypothetical protein NDU88_006536 [Pleurodeles waltl]|uniref:Uncharacterized protein n=1 Tax=Pleurodeles waltl TaxID=8319 RepID=A0AAV7N3S1_PLEWA|nr:hypothetical protein NDU88_006536 [Pleurodeles waltl]